MKISKGDALCLDLDKAYDGTRRNSAKLYENVRIRREVFKSGAGYVEGQCISSVVRCMVGVTDGRRWKWDYTEAKERLGAYAVAAHGVDAHLHHVNP